MPKIHYHLMNGEVGCIPDSNEVYTRQRDAIEWAETLFGHAICDRHFREMSRELRSRWARKYGTSYYFDHDCEDECNQGAYVVEFVHCTDSDCMIELAD